MPIPYHKPHIAQDEIDEVIDTIRSGWLTMGPKTIQFETNFAQYLDVPHALSVNSATAALHLALKAMGLKAGDEVILPTNTFVATAEVVTYFKAVPVICDIEPCTHNMDVTQIESLITSETKAIIPVHFAGTPCDMDAIMAIAQKYQLKVIEDAAHALPAVYKGRKIGTIGDMTCFSFYATKTLCTGEGGMVTTQNPEYAKTIKINRLHGISRDAWDRYSSQGHWFYEIVDNGHKYNMTDINAALGLVQLKKLEWMASAREKIAQQYLAAFKQSGVGVLDVPDHSRSAWHLFVIKVGNRDDLIQKLKDAQIGCSVHFIPVHKHPYYQDHYHYPDADYPVANAVFQQSISLPIYPGMTSDQVQTVIDLVLQYAKAPQPIRV